MLVYLHGSGPVARRLVTSRIVPPLVSLAVSWLPEKPAAATISLRAHRNERHVSNRQCKTHPSGEKT